MNEQYWIDLLANNIQFTLRHPNYDRAIEVREFAHMAINGKKQEKVVNKFKRNEHDELKDQRNNLTVTLTKLTLDEPRLYWKKVASVEGIKTVFSEKDKAKEQILHENFDDFYQGMDLRGFLTWKLEHLGTLSPNDWIIYERMDRRDVEGNIEQTRTYPWVISCIDALNFETRRGNLEWLIVRESRLEASYTTGQRVERLLTDFFLYAPGVVVRMREVGEMTAMETNEAPINLRVGGSTVTIPTASAPIQIPASGDTLFYLSTYQNGTVEVPAEIAGAYYDDETEQQSYVPWFWPAENAIIRLIRDVSLSDVDTILNAFRKRWEFVRQCKYQAPDKAYCKSGRLNGDPERICPNCGGNGLQPNFSTEQMVTQLAWPEGMKAEDIVELSKLAFTEDPLVDFSRWLEEKTEIARRRIKNAILPMGLVDQATGSPDKLATEMNYAYEGLYDRLRAYLNTISRHYEKAYRVGAQYLGIKDFQVSDQYPKNLKMEPAATQIGVLKGLREAGATYESILAKQLTILENQFQDDPIVVLRARARYRWLPFNDKSETELAMTLAMRAPDDFWRVLWENHKQIFEEIENEDKAIAGAADKSNDVRPEFYQLSYQKQEGVVRLKVAKYAAMMTLNDAQPMDPNADTGLPQNDSTGQPDANANQNQ